MELGNAMFGHSRGMYEIDRYRPAERRLMDLMTLMRHATLTVDKVVDRINRSKVVMLGAERDMTKECASALVNFDEDALERLDVAAKTVVWTR